MTSMHAGPTATIIAPRSLAYSPCPGATSTYSGATPPFTKSRTGFVTGIGYVTRASARQRARLIRCSRIQLAIAFCFCSLGSVAP